MKSSNNLLIHLNSITERGTTTASIEYAHMLRLRGIESTFLFPKNHPTNHSGTVKILEENFDVEPYLNFGQIAKRMEARFESAYFLKGGHWDEQVFAGMNNYIHAVFQNDESHGTSSAYVSEWLADEMKRKGLKNKKSKGVH